RPGVDLAALGGDHVAPLVAARRRERLHAGVVALGHHGRAVGQPLGRVGALAREPVDLVDHAAGLGAEPDDEHRDAELARGRDLAERLHVLVAAVGEDRDRLAALDLLLDHLAARAVLGLRIEAVTAAQRVAAVAAPPDPRAA